MPYGSVQILTIAPAGQGSALILAEKGIITGAGMMAERTGLGNAEAYCEIFLVSSDAPTPIKILLLASGYIGASSSVGWDGHILAEPAFNIQGFVFCVREFPFRMTVLTEVI